MSLRTALLYSAMVLRNCSAFTPSSLCANSSIVLAATLVICRMLVFVALQVLHLLVEDLPGELARLLQHHAAVFGIGVVAEIGALVDEALAGGVDQDGERIGVLLELVADREVAEFRRVHLPLHRVAARPVAARARADVQRHADAVAGVEAGAAHLGEVPAGAEIARAPFGIGLEAAAGEHDRLAAQLAFDAVVPDAHAFDADAVDRQG